MRATEDNPVCRDVVELQDAPAEEDEAGGQERSLVRKKTSVTAHKIPVQFQEVRGFAAANQKLLLPKM